MPDSPDHALTMPLSVCILACKDMRLNMRAIRQAKALADAGHDVTIVSWRSPDPHLVAGSRATLIATGDPPFVTPLMAALWVTGRVFRSPMTERRIAAAGVAAGRSRAQLFARRVDVALAGRSFDVVQAHFDKALHAGSELARRCGAKLVFDAVEVPFDPEMLPRDPTTRALRLAEIQREVEVMRDVDSWITVNDALADAAVERFGIARPLVLRNLPSGEYQPSDGRLRRDVGLPETARIILHLNTMRKGEGLETAIDALAQLPDQYHLVGLGPAHKSYLPTIRQRAAQRGVAQRFHLAPLQPPHKVAAYIAGADVGIICREGDMRNLRLSLPNRVFQMIAARLPVVATPLPEIARIVRDWRIGEVFGEGDGTGLAAAIQQVSDPLALPGYRQAVAKTAQTLCWEQECGPYVQLIEKLGRAARIEAGSLQAGHQRVGGKELSYVLKSRVS
jgi:glycosyltransferase involved in cell wall biosynthesis